MAAYDRRQADRESVLLYIRLLILDALGADTVVDANTEGKRLAERFMFSGWSAEEIAALILERARLAGVEVKGD